MINKYVKREELSPVLIAMSLILLTPQYKDLDLNKEELYT